MEIEVWQLAKSAVDLVKSLNSSFDSYYYLAYLALMLFKRETAPVIFLILFLSFLFEITLNLPEYQFFILCSIASTYVMMYYNAKNNRVCIGLALMAFYLFMMGQESLINVISQQFYNSLYDSYELCISFIHLLIIALFIRWKRVFNSLVKFFHDTRSGQNGVNYLFNVL